MCYRFFYGLCNFIIVFITLYTLYYLFNKQVKCSISEGFASAANFTLEKDYKNDINTEKHDKNTSTQLHTSTTDTWGKYGPCMKNQQH